MSLKALQAQGHDLSAPALSFLKKSKLSLAQVLALVKQYGPQVIGLIEALAAGTPLADLVAKYGDLAIRVAEVILGSLTPPAAG